MIKLLIVDDEPIIRESILESVDWEEYDIKIIGLAENGIDAYNIILDEYPEIVITDINMPGLSGIDLIENIKEINDETEFIILSGYQDFEYAKSAMKFGVKYYLLKPFTKNDILESIMDTVNEIEKKQIIKKYNTENSINSIEVNIIWTIINDRLTSADKYTDELYKYKSYEKYINLTTVSYEIMYCFFVEYSNIKMIVEQINRFRNKYCLSTYFVFLYVNNTLLFFYKSYEGNSKNLEVYIKEICEAYKNEGYEYKQKKFENLSFLLDELLMKICRYEKIYYSIGGDLFSPIYNYQIILNELNICLSDFKLATYTEIQSVYKRYCNLLEPIVEIDLIKQIAQNTVIQLILYYSPNNIMIISEELVKFNSINDPVELKKHVIGYIDYIIDTFIINYKNLKISDQIKVIVSKSLQNSNLSLKWIAENIIFMNVDYLSRKFLKETGMKFSKYLQEQRINRSKILLEQYTDSSKISEIPSLVGFGNNPQYFNQLFKKETGMTPTKYIKTLGVDIVNDK